MAQMETANRQALEDREVDARCQNLKHFLRLAKRGVCPGSSGGEKRAGRLARMIVDNVPGLDDEAVAGLIDFIRLAQAKPSTATDLLE